MEFSKIGELIDRIFMYVFIHLFSYLSDVYKEFMKLEHGQMKFYDCRNYVSGEKTDESNQ